MTESKQDLKSINAPLYGYLKALYLSFFSQRLYKDVGNRWRGYGVVYLLLLLAILSIPISLRIMLDFNEYFNQNLIEPLRKLPPIMVQNGEVNFDKPMPYIIKNEKGEPIVIIDTEGKFKTIFNQFPKLAILITKNKIYHRIIRPRLFFANEAPLPDEVAVQPLSKESNEIFVAKDWLETSGVLKFKYFAMMVIYPLVLCFFFVFYLSTLLVFAFLGQLLARMFFDLKLKFKESCRIFAVASTPQVALFMMLLSTEFLFPGIGFVCIALQSIYFCYGVIAVKRSRSALVYR
ncbi:DUF1189 family protein [Legionella londiniensis]|uniref:DUF1189 domain-containing protein n=1 Tax=Legionella londiniensis TaxID=45068 RepID=A0A0W0VN86_9GAMM|nr:DUF1189 family protein [Legionella londiniensis]KTD21632.1 hypothetical protein Llon_0797 [Legionella londiniensis]STX93403.1 Protein of uncharacterised function (DUF1189) [Legionella londiniensis]